MDGLKCSVCGFLEKSGVAPAKCPVCGADKLKFTAPDANPATADSTMESPAQNSRDTTQWKCTVCGYIHNGGQPPEKCPVCGADKKMFTSLDQDLPKDASVPKPRKTKTPDPSNQKTSKWKCTVCGYIHTGDEPPEKCPVCGADKSMFILVSSAAPDMNKMDSNQEQKKTDTQENLLATLSQKAKLLTRLHGHPIAVHIPNGVLPLTVLFTLLAFIFKSNSFALAAKLNLFFVCISMPAVLATGLIDWYNRFAGRITNVFRIKMLCGAIVTLLTFVLAAWWLISPNIYLSGIGQGGLFLLINFFNLLAAATAGFFGGKLVFHD